jgi:hypothetical protein
MTEQPNAEQFLAEAMTTLWEDEKEDRAILREIFSTVGAKLKLAFYEGPSSPSPDNPTKFLAIHGSSLEPLRKAWTDFFKNKFPGQKGELLFTKYWNSVQIKYEPERGFILREMVKSSLLGV